MHDIWIHLVDSATAFALSFAVFGLLARYWPNVPGQSLLRPGMATDAFYWFVPSVVYGLVQSWALAFLWILLLGNDFDRIAPIVQHGWGPVGRLPIWAQIPLSMLVYDLLAYAWHRWFHTNGPWAYHAIHHSSEHLDWLSATRFHPVNALLSFNLTTMAILLMGFSPKVFLLLWPFNIAINGFVHANLTWTLGPLRYVIATPVFHRWHHTGVKEGGMKNFAPTFPFIDLVFGTFYMPPGRQPAKFGVHGDGPPPTVWGQMVYPFRRRRKS